MFYSKNTTPLSLDDIINASVILKCEPAAILAVSEIEAPKGGFLADGRPSILFEAHVFSKYTKHQYDLSHPNISSSTWNRALYGKDGSHQYDRLAEALKLSNEDAALMACSWGKYQLMGFNYRECRYPDITEFIDAMVESEAEQLAAFVNFILHNNKLTVSLRTKDWNTFTEFYNGKGQIPYYSSRISSVYPACTKKVQQYLKDLGYYSDKVDGLWGKNSKLALTNYLAGHNATIIL